jgi:hypothetical protein
MERHWDRDRFGSTMETETGKDIERQIAG